MVWYNIPLYHDRPDWPCQTVNVRRLSCLVRRGVELQGKALEMAGIQTAAARVRAMDIRTGSTHRGLRVREKPHSIGGLHLPRCILKSDNFAEACR